MRYVRILSLITISCFLAACASTTASQESSGNTDNLEGLQQLKSAPPKLDEDKKSDAISAIREEALQETAITVGAQAGLHWRSDKINQQLVLRSQTLDKIFNFNALILPNNVLPPVLTEARQTLSLDGSDVIRLADRTYAIVDQAKFVTTPPTWRDYLWMNYPAPDVPDKSVLPQTSAEVKLWKQLVAKGWQEGIDQANQIYAENLSRLERDYDGMMLYRNLRAQNIVSAPFVARTNLGITGGGSSLNIDDQVLRITALPALQSNSKNWAPALSTEPMGSDDE